MTSNERKIINFLRDAKEKTHIRLIAKKTNFSSDYTQSLCHSLARAGYIKLEDSNVCHLLKKGEGHFESVAVMREISEPVVVTANVTLLTDEPAGAPLANERDDKADDDAELDNALTNLEPSSQKDADEETKIADAEAELKPEPEEEIKEKEPASEAGTETKAKAVEIEEEKKTMPQEMDEEIKIKPADNPALAASLENPEKAVSKEESAEPSGGFGASFKKIVNWFAEKK